MVYKPPTLAHMWYPSWLHQLRRQPGGSKRRGFSKYPMMSVRFLFCVDAFSDLWSVISAQVSKGKLYAEEEKIIKRELSFES